MALFQFFPNLPPEIRLQIWESAIRPFPDGPTAIHYLTIVDARKVGPKKRTVCLRGPFSHQDKSERGIDYITKVPGLGDDKAVNRSVYMWDVGLWTACWESRLVIMNKLHMEEWKMKAEDLFERLQGPYPNFHITEKGLRVLINGTVKGGDPTSAKKPKFYHLLTRLLNGTVKGSDPTLAKKPKSYNLMTCPLQDVVCLDIRNIKSLIPTSKWNGLWNGSWLLPSCNEFTNMIFEPPGNQRTIIFEFEPSWNVNLPKSLDQLLKEPSPRGFIANLVNVNHRRERNNPDFYNRGFIWLLDRKCRCANTWPTGPTIYYDCEDEFVRVPLLYLPNKNSVVFFLRWLGYMFWIAQGGLGGLTFLRTYLGVLGRKAKSDVS